MRTRILAVFLLVVGVIAGYFVYPRFGIPEFFNIPFRLGLDLQGGVHLIYKADLSQIPLGQGGSALEGLRDVIERRVNFFGVSEPEVRTERTLGESHLSVKLAGVFDTARAIQLIGETPFLEFRTERKDTVASDLENDPLAFYEPTELNGRYLQDARMDFDQNNSPYVYITFNPEGAKIFEKLTEENIDKTIAIFLDGVPISTPVVRQKISGGTAQITGQFTPEEARLLAQRLHSGALPVPIELISQERVEATHGAESLAKSFFSGLVGLLLVMVFMILWYRLSGLIAVVALLIYGAFSLTLFKLIPVTFTTAGIAGFILSVGMAVDANVLIFERMKEELKRGRTLGGALEEGFDRAWNAIRDSNISSIMTALILWFFGTDAVKGFALTLGLGIVVSMFTAIVITRTFMRAIQRRHGSGETVPFLYKSGFGW
ncbi:MAG: protein-export membrane protein SecD [Candidatus Ryanbacteria bacterium RIFCSPHIGHO2_12_FULL_47_12b]|uniref:Protein translocase subunit SecD n=1 Tax=Candidatus Ryanbacteria bacterium RIFCSPLOWO2_12_FULL_47_9c TaxID=1802131 RepID=A0A1G2H6F8_9BACT|nr:MAG: protein-export membrane protein SecD [Candidatus Ryanbacteria bacterium RIFCSPHIGHO2_01_FULL_48_80]OGZ48364.1 MAG: protein-export membrane protein SecD [Candidatus Ryanbacteria bacterium RIFCSPHIGHO2_02_FULL_47_25]OGZ51731.1 MAG: protein-export membrane protein SecD [Candidatus Ryanbacteria bacterium RIFCSPLOWO2_01_FULL_47_79]OGZ52617.1 MAG: protein-export membrane protein SecD [Candidatus Ryanbacteria bacterium RIFCSPHIGHO2_12_FULL_47_12b]OGZ57528.1 MAG: protein-export membrane protein